MLRQLAASAASSLSSGHVEGIGTAKARPAIDRQPWTSVITLSAGVCCGLSWLIPNHYLPWNSFYNESAMVIGLLLLTAAMQIGHVAASTTAVGCVVIAVATIPGLQWMAKMVAFSGDAVVATLYLLLTSTAIGAGFAAARADSQTFAAWLATVALTAALMSSVLAMVQCFEIGRGSIWVAGQHPSTRGTGNLAQPNNLSSLLGLGAVGLWLLREQGRIGAIAAAALLVPLLIGGALAQSRTALMFGPTLLMLRWFAARRGVVWATGAKALVAVILLQCLTAWAWPGLAAGLGLSTEPNGRLDQRGLQTGRLQVWPVLLDGLSLAPWTGYGWLHTGTAQLAVAERHPVGDELFLQAHNLFLDLLIWCGLPLGLLLCGLLVYWFASRIWTASSIEAAIGLMVFAVFGVHAMLELPHHYAYFLIPVGLWVGLIEAERGSRGVGPRWAAPALVAGTAALAVAVAWDYPAVEEDFRLVRFENLSIGSLRATRPAPEAPFLSSLTGYLRFMRLPINPGMAGADLAHMDAVARRYPYSTVLYRYGKALALNGRLAESLLLFDKLRHIHGEPRYQSLRQVLHRERLDGQPALTPLDDALPG